MKANKILLYTNLVIFIDRDNPTNLDAQKYTEFFTFIFPMQQKLEITVALCPDFRNFQLFHM